MDLHFCMGQDSHLEVAVLVCKDRVRRVLVVEAVVHVHIRRPIVLLVVVDFSFHSHGHSPHIVLFPVSVRADSLLENSPVEGDLDGRKVHQILVVRSDAEEYEIDSPYLAVGVLPESSD